MSAPRAALSWSSGKDAAMALLEARREGLADVCCLVTTVNEHFDRVAMHGTRGALLRAQAAALGLPLVEVPLPWPCPNAVYEARMVAVCTRLRAEGITHMVCGDIHLEDVRAWRAARLAEAGLAALFPLWGRESGALARAVIASGIRARAVTVDPARVPAALAGAAYDAAFLAALPPGCDPCGENGEFHTAVTDMPGFAAPLAVTPGESVTRDGFVFADLIPAAGARAFSPRAAARARRAPPRALPPS